MVHSKASTCMEEGGSQVKPTWTLCLKEIISAVAKGRREKQEINKNLKTLIKMFRKNGAEIMAALLKEGL